MTAEMFEWSRWFDRDTRDDDSEDVPIYFRKDSRRIDAEDAVIFCAALYAAGAALADRLSVPRAAVVSIARAAVYEMAHGPVACTDVEEMRLAVAGAAEELSRLYAANPQWWSGDAA